MHNPFAKRRASSPLLTYADLFEMVRYDRGMDVMPYAIAYRPKPPLTDPTGPEPCFTLLDSEAEVGAFLSVFNGPALIEVGAVSVAPLLRWNDQPSGLMADSFIAAFYYPDDETAGWPELIVSAYSPGMIAGKLPGTAELARGRYAFEQFEQGGKHRYVERLAALQTSGPKVFIDGKVPFSMVDMLNPRQPGNSDQ